MMNICLARLSTIFRNPILPSHATLCQLFNITKCLFNFILYILFVFQFSLKFIPHINTSYYYYYYTLRINIGSILFLCTFHLIVFFSSSPSSIFLFFFFGSDLFLCRNFSSYFVLFASFCWTGGFLFFLYEFACDIYACAHSIKYTLWQMYTHCVKNRPHVCVYVFGFDA